MTTYCGDCDESYDGEANPLESPCCGAPGYADLSYDDYPEDVWEYFADPEDG